MREDRLRERRYQRLRRIEDAGWAALTLLRAKRYLARYPKDIGAWVLLGRTYIDLARYQEAEATLQEGLRRYSNEERWIVLCQFGHLHQERGEYDRAAEWYRQVIEASPRDATGYIYLGAVLAKQGQLTEAEETHQTATEECYEGCIDEAFLNLGFLLRAQERYAEAAECFRETLRIDPVDRHARRALRDVERCLAEPVETADGAIPKNWPPR